MTGFPVHFNSFQRLSKPFVVWPQSSCHLSLFCTTTCLLSWDSLCLVCQQISFSMVSFLPFRRSAVFVHRVIVHSIIHRSCLFDYLNVFFILWDWHRVSSYKSETQSLLSLSFLIEIIIRVHPGYNYVVRWTWMNLWYIDAKRI